jgi:hypothetical protein
VNAGVGCERLSMPVLFVGVKLTQEISKCCHETKIRRRCRRDVTEGDLVERSPRLPTHDLIHSYVTACLDQPVSTHLLADTRGLL